MTIQEIYKQYGLSKGESGFGLRSFDGFHWGNDLPTPVGVPIHAHVGGRLALSGFYDGVGIVVLEYADGSYNDQFGHLNRTIHPQGAIIEKGALLGYTGSTGATSAHLHYERDKGKFKGSITKNHQAGTTIDPLPYLKGGSMTEEDYQKRALTEFARGSGIPNPEQYAIDRILGGDNHENVVLKDMTTLHGKIVELEAKVKELEETGGTDKDGELLRAFRSFMKEGD